MTTHTHTLKDHKFSNPKNITAMNAPTEVCKRQKKTDENCQTISTDDDDDDQTVALIPGLPNHLANLCLSSLHDHPSLLYSVCHSWRRLIYSANFPPFFSLYALLSSSTSSVEFSSFDPISSAWKSLSSPPSNPPLKLLHRHSSFISRILPIQSLTVSGRYLILLAGTNADFLPALPCPLAFDPLSNKWFFGPPFLHPRRWCITGTFDGAIYVVSGIGSVYNGNVARSMEKWDMKKEENYWSWEQMAALRDAKFSREAVEAVHCNRKLCIVNVKGNAVKEAAVYDILSNSWGLMPEGMRGGWNGPAAADEDNGGVMYVVDETTGVLSRYVFESDRWEKVIESEVLKGAQQIAAGRGRVCVVSGGGARIVVVDVVEKPARFWVVSPPPEMEAVAVHILPRMIQADYNFLD